MPTPRASKKRRNAPAPRGPSPVRAIILIDQTALRRNTSRECMRLMARVEKARAEWTHFEQKDLPAFARWIAALFGPLMTRSRELSDLIREKEYLVAEVEEESWATASPPHLAYRRVIHRREHPQPEYRPPGGPGHDRDPNADFDDGGPPDEFELEMMFDELLRNVGINPDRLGNSAYEQLFGEFKDKFGPRPSGPPPFQGDDRYGDSPPRASRTPPSQRATQARIKEIYRILVRRLHPDLRADGDAAVSSIWHEVQEAYNAADLDRLETLLALTDIKSNQAGDHTSLSQMHAVLEELARNLRALQKSLRQARKDDAWNFSRSNDRTTLETNLRHKLETELEDQQRRLQDLEALIRDWSRPRNERAKNLRHTRPAWEELF